MDITEQEQQMLELLREWNKSRNYHLQIEIVDGVWDIAMKELGTQSASRGMGESFNAAWDNMTPLHFPGAL